MFSVRESRLSSNDAEGSDEVTEISADTPVPSLSVGRIISLWRQPDMRPLVVNAKATAMIVPLRAARLAAAGPVSFFWAP